MAGILHDDWRLHKLCQDGKLKKVTDYVNKLDTAALEVKLSNHKGVFGYTPLHEATANGHAFVLDFLLSKGGDVNCRANSGYTPLHLAASSGHVECVKMLLDHKADISLTDEFGKTPKQTAELSSKSSIVRLLKSEEIIKEVENDGDNLTELLRYSADQLQPDCLNRALTAAVRNGNHFNVGKLIVKGATNIDEALQLSKQLNKHTARAILLLVKAAMKNDRNLVLKLFGDPVPGMDMREYQNEGFVEVQRAVFTGKVSTVVPIEIARRSGHSNVREELLLRTDVNQDDGSVYWHGLRLLVLDVSWLRKIHWVKRLRLARNGFKVLPNEMGTYLRQVVKLDLQYNDLSTVPRCIMELPSLSELNLSHNKLTDIPDVPEWSSCLTVLDLSHNRLSSIPGEPIAASIRSLNLSDNLFRTVPQCVCFFTTLHSLDLSNNQDILTLPAQMGKLASLIRLNLKGLKDLNDPPRNVQRDPRDCIRYLNIKYRCAKGFYRMKLMLVGKQNRGKTTLVARLQGRDCGNESTVGVDVSEWEYRPAIGKRTFHFSIWDFGGQEEYYATHQCFLSQHSLYLLLFNLKHGEEGIEELKPWLNNIELRAPHSCVVIVGTHLDEVADDEREKVDVLLQQVGKLARRYGKKLQIAQVLPVGLKNRLENIGGVKDAIYESAANYRTRTNQVVMGRKIPASYHQLDKQLAEIQQEVRNGNRDPIMHAEEFRTMVQQMKLTDIQEDDELRTATLFLTDVGSLLHYDDRSHNLHELYFVDPRWLCDMMSKVVTIKEKNPFINNGILCTMHIPFLFRDERFPWQYFEQYLTLLDRFEIALPLDNQRILIPSMLPDERPKDIDVENPHSEPLYTRYIMFSVATTPPGFWSRLLSRVMHSVPQVRFALDKHIPHAPEDISLSFNPATSTDDSVGKIGVDMSVPVIDNGTEFISTPASSLDKKPGVMDGSTPTEYANSVGNSMISMPTGTFEQAPIVIPNFPSALPFKPMDFADPSDVKLRYWRTGLFYQDPELMFRVESLLDSKQFTREKKDGILIVTSPTSLGKKIIGQLVDLTVSLVSEWYPGLQDPGMGRGGGGLQQKVPCYECLKLRRDLPFEFQVEQCLPLIAQNKVCIECGYHRDDPAKNHTVSFADIVPDLLLHDLDPDFLLQASQVVYDEKDPSCLLGAGGYGKVYRGRCKEKPVAIKKYLSRDDEAFAELRREATLLQRSHHPCLVCLVGVCVHPMMALVLEEAPMGSLERPLIKKQQPIHRVVIYRMAAQVAAALKFLHSNGIIFRDLKAANVLLWSLDPDSLCHCKVTDFGIATYLAPIGSRGLHGTKGFIAPEVLHIGKKKEHSVYDHTADIFSFGMLLYQMIARRHPYHDTPPVKIDIAVETGDRPKLQDVSLADTAYYYLTKLMQRCWLDDPRKRPSTADIVDKVCLSAMQSVMCVQPVRSRFSLRRVCVITPSDFTQANIPRTTSELWVCCDGAEGAEINIYATNTMVKISKNFIKENQVQCICLCGDHVWVGSRAGIEYGVIDIFNINNRELVHNIRMRENSVSCITCSNKMVYCGTLEGYCFSFCLDIQRIQSNEKPRYKYISEHAVDGIVATRDCLWVSHTRYIYFLNLESLTMEGSLPRHDKKDAFVGQLSPSAKGDIIWSAHLGGTVLSAWDALHKRHLFDVDTEQHVRNISYDSSSQDVVITAMTPALDTVWVGMASGHLLVFHDEELVVWYHPYNDYIRFLAYIPCEGPCQTEQSMVVSGAKSFRSPMIADFGDYEKEDDKGLPTDRAGTLILWEAFTAQRIRQICLLEMESQDFLESHHTVRKMIRRGDFKDGTHLIQNREVEGRGEREGRDAMVSGFTIDSSDDRNPFNYPPGDGDLLLESIPTNHTRGRRTDGLDTGLFPAPAPPTPDTESSFSPMAIPEEEEPTMVRTRARTATMVCETVDVNLPPDWKTSVRLSCPKPAKLTVLLSELEMNANIPADRCLIEYRLSNSGECVKVRSQAALEKYLKIDNRPKLFLSKP